MEYDDWISHSNTWLSLGDKCAFHSMFALATDMYALGMMKDVDAFKKPMLWLRFAKACMRCGRSADAQLAIKQALTYDPFNMQLLRTQKFWLTSPTTFQDVVKGELKPLLLQIPAVPKQENVLISRTQAILKGVLERRALRLGVGTRKDITNRMTAKLGVVLGGAGGVAYPVILIVRPSWSGLINTIRVFDLSDNHLACIPLKVPFAPMKETGLPRKLSLSLSCRKVTLLVPLKKALGSPMSKLGSPGDHEMET
ncbi:hypothetical protein B484DRAFT_392610, partial [Ochromonadaceae sp. CCMP2298]